MHKGGGGFKKKRRKTERESEREKERECMYTLVVLRGASLRMRSTRLGSAWLSSANAHIGASRPIGTAQALRAAAPLVRGKSGRLFVHSLRTFH